jgi:hypothetical protein
MAKKKDAADKKNGEQSPAQLMSPEQAACIRTMMQGIAKQQIEIMTPRPVLGGSIVPSGKYDGAMHARLISLKTIGLTNAHVAQAAGIAPATLTGWCEKYPMLKAQLEQAASLAIASAGTLLQAIMLGDDDKAFRAVRFFLESHAAEFRTKAKPDLSDDLRTLAETIREGIYGLPRRLPDAPRPITAQVLDRTPGNFAGHVDHGADGLTPAEAIDQEFADWDEPSIEGAP